MGRAEDLAGIEVRATSIRIRFKYRGTLCKETLYVGDKAMAPTGPNIEFAKRQIKIITKAIQNDNFNYAYYFPKSSHFEKLNGDAGMLHNVMDKWMSLYEGKASTRSQYQSRLDNFWKKALKNQPIVNVRYSDILGALQSGTWTSGKSRNNELSLIRGVFEFAKLDNLIIENPCAGVKRAGYQKPPPDPFDFTEVNTILSHLQKCQSEQVWNFVQFMFFSGLRTSEGLALKWLNVDFRKREAIISGANVYDEETNETKTYESRVVKLNGMALEALQRQKAHTFLQGEHIFHDPKTRAPWLYTKITDVRAFWKTSLKKLGIRYRRPYNMRHTYATIGLMNGVTPAFMAAQLGHSLRTFFRDYAKWISGAQDEREMEKLDAAILRNSPTIPGTRIHTPALGSQKKKSP